MLTAGPKWVAQRILLPALSAAFLLVLPATAVAATCGDDIDGVRVPCACDDTVVTDTKLAPSDPVVSGRCSFNGLTVAAVRTAESITLDLDGLSLVGRGVGVGVRILYGGSDGAVISGGATRTPAEVVGFGTGIWVPRSKVLRRLENVVVRGNTRDGIAMRTSGAILSDIGATQNGGTGIRLTGRGGQLRGIVATRNRGSGVHLSTDGVLVQGTVSGNGRHGIVCEGRRNDISGVVASDNRDHGALVRGLANETRGLVRRGNGSPAVTRKGRRIPR